MSTAQEKYFYKEQNGCHNCKHCFERGDYDEGPECFCNINDDRPKCGSTAMNEVFDFKRKDMDEYDLWEEWAEKNRVHAWGICEKYKHI